MAVGIGLGLSACSDPQETAIDQLTKSGYAFNVTDYHRAAAAGHTDSIDLFLSSGMAVDAPDANGRTALLIASAAGRGDVCQKLLSLGASPAVIDSDSRTPLIHAAATGNTELMEALLQAGADPLVKDKSQWCALTEAAFHGNAEAVAVLAPLSRQFLDGALHLACVGGDLGTIDALLRSGASVFARSREEKTALMYAAANGHPSVVKLLIKNGANRFALDGMGKTASELATLGGHETIAIFLSEPPSDGEKSQAAPTFVLNAADLPASTDVESAEPKFNGSDPEGFVDLEKVNAKPTPKKDSVLGRAKVAAAVAKANLGGLGAKAVAPSASSSRKVAPSKVASSKVIPRKSPPAKRVRPPAPRIAQRGTPQQGASSVQSSPRGIEVQTRRLDGVALEQSLAPRQVQQPHSLNGASAPLFAQAGGEHFVSPIRMYDYRESQLPVMLTDVFINSGRIEDRRANVRLLYGEFVDPISVIPGQMIADTGLRVIDVQRHVVQTKQGKGVPVDVSRMIVENAETGARHLVVKDMPAMSNNVYAVVSLGDEQDTVFDARSDDRFTAAGGEESYRILDVRPNQIVILQEDSGITFTIPRTTHHGGVQ